ncbi:nicotinate-nucleotide--dimethylbenzimidazole phosphoribosyltransferase [Streptomyces griseosporeus]|uniref:nicotinate-nucleotide--dimethylbenzimidazole phosphoribosyltransferase n=1 Tax=Streptomyces griseosporeus TaxID=1910 RepID=UPI0036BF2662
MTDTGQVPGEGLPENAGTVEQPGVTAPAAYTHLSETTAEDEDLLLPGSGGAWGNEVAPPAPEPVVEAVHEPGPHELSGRDSGSVDLGGVRLPNSTPRPTAPTVPIPPITPRRPLHLGPPIPDTSASPVRSLADRGPAGVPARQPGPPTTGPEYLDVPPVRETAPQSAAPWPAQAQAAPGATTAETVVPAPQPEPVGAAQAAVARLTSEAAAATGQTGQIPMAATTAEAAETPQGAAPAPAPEPQAAPGDAAVASAETTDGTAQAATPAQGVPVADGQGSGADAPEAGLVPEAADATAAEGVAQTPEAAVAAGPEAEVAAGQEPGTAPAPAAPEAETVPAAQAAAVDASEAGAAGAPEAAAVQTAEAAAVEAPEAAAVEAPEAAAVEAAEAALGEAPEAAAVQASGAAVVEAPEVVAVPGPEGAPAPEGVSAPETAPAAEAPAPDAAQPVVPAPAEVGPAMGEPVAAAVEAAPAPEAAPVAEPAEAAESAQTAPQVAAPAAAEQAQAVTPEAVPTVETPVPEAPAAEPTAPVAVTAPEAPAPEAPAPAATAPAAAAPEVAAPEVAAPEAPAPETAVAPDAAAPDATAPDATAPEAAAPAAIAADMTPPQMAAPAAPTADTMAAPAAPTADTPEAAPAPQVPSADDAPQAQPADAVEAAPAPEAVADVVEPVAQPAEAEAQAQPAPEAVPAPAPEALAHPDAVPAVAPDAVPAAEAAQLLTPEAAPMAEPAPAAAPEAVPAPAPAPAEAAAPTQQPQPQPEAQAPTPSVQMADAAVQQAATPFPPDGTPQPMGQFVPVEGTVPTTPHLAPTPPHALTLPVDEQQVSGPVTVPAPREAEAGDGVVQHAEDLRTRAEAQDEQAEQDEREEGTAAVADAPQATGPAAPAYDDAEREAVLKVMRERRDIRNGFRSDPIPHEVLLRVLEAAHHAPSVGHSQPWDFVVIRSADTRRAMHELAMRQREAYAKSLPKGRAKQFKELKIEAILDTPVNIVVTADPTRGGRHTLGRHTQPQMAPYSAALAVENLWLAARAEGLGVGWVSFFDEREMVRALGLPEHLEVIAYLCVGYVDEFPDEPELMQAGWSKRRPLSWVVHEETYGRRALPGEEPHDLLAETVAQIRPLDAKALGEAWERQKRMTKPAGALGMLEIISAQLSGLSRQCPPPIPEPAAVAIFAGDHGVHAQGVTPWPQEVTAQMVANFLGGGAVCNAFANQVGAEVCVVDVGVVADLPATPGLLPRKIRGGTSDMTTGPAMTREEAKKAIEVGIETARDLVAAGNKALLTGEMGIANTTASAALISVFTGADPAEVTGRGTGINDETLARKTEVVRRALELHQPDPADPIGVLAAIGGFEHAAMVGLLLGGASLRTPVILDGVSAGAAALVARAIAPEVLAACIAGHRSAEPGHVAALNKLGLRPLVDLDLRLGEGTGALLALPLVQSTARAMHEVATFDSAGVTEK